MKFASPTLIATFFLGLTFGIPLFVLAANNPSYIGPLTTPPNGNVPGVIWNTKGTGIVQDADISVSGTAKMLLVQTALDNDNTLNGNQILQNGKSFKINDGTSGSYTMETRDPASNNLKPFTLNLTGGLKINHAVLGVPVLGSDGRLQADKICFNPGNPADCISAWSDISGGGAAYVQKTGDTMTGLLGIGVNLAGYGLYVTNVGAGGGGISASAPTLAISGNATAANSYGGYLTTTGAGGTALYLSATAGTGLKLPNSLVGLTVTSTNLGADISSPAGVAARFRTLSGKAGDFSGPVSILTTAIQPSASLQIDRQSLNGPSIFINAPSSEGLNIISGGTALDINVPTTFATHALNIVSGGKGIDIQSFSPAIEATSTGQTMGLKVVAPNGTGAYFQGGKEGVYVKSSGNIIGEFRNAANWISIGYHDPSGFEVGVDSDVGAGNLGLRTNGDISVGGDIRASANTLSNCAWTTALSTGDTICPFGKIMAGVRKNASIVSDIYCCEL